MAGVTTMLRAVIVSFILTTGSFQIEIRRITRKGFSSRSVILCVPLASHPSVVSLYITFDTFFGIPSSFMEFLEIF